MKQNRREFLKGATAATAATVASPLIASEKSSADKSVVVTPPTHQQRADETGENDLGLSQYSPEEEAKYFVDDPVSDFMVDTIKSLGIDYISVNAGSSFRGLHESLINYGGNKKPEILTCLHEESAVAIAHGYAKAEGKPMAMLCHGTVGTQHAAMAVYNAYCDRAPMLLFGGNYSDEEYRSRSVEWSHAAQNAAAPIKDYIKFHAAPQSASQFAEDVVRAYKIAMTPPMGPVFISIDKHLQEKSMGGKAPAIPTLSPTIAPQGNNDALDQTAKWLVEAENPVIVADHFANTPEGMDSLVELAELLQAPVIDRAGRMNFPNRHYLAQFANAGTLLREADLILGLEVEDLYGLIYKTADTVELKKYRVVDENVKLISIGVGDLYLQSNYQNFQRYQPVDLSIAGEGQATVARLIELINNNLNKKRRKDIASREQRFRTMHKRMSEANMRQAAIGWDVSPVSVPRLCMEVWHQIKDLDWSMLGSFPFQSYWPHRLWNFDKHHRHTGGSTGWGIGYGAPAAAGVALANQAKGRFTVSIQSDGDLMYAPGVLWTIAHHRIPVLYVMHNNRAYHQEIVHLQRVSARRQRGVDDGQAKIGNAIENPNIDFAQMARSMGVWSTGPISDPNELGAALKKAVEVVKSGEPALVDVVCQPR